MAERTWTSCGTAEAFRDALEARLGHDARQQGVPANRLRKEAVFHRLLARFVALDLEDWFRFEFGDPQEMEGEVPGRMALRYPVTSFLGAREFERVHLDVNFISHDDPRPVESTVVRRNPFSFVGADTLTVPMIGGQLGRHPC